MKRTAHFPTIFIFDWSRTRWDHRLLWLIVASLGLHFAGLYIFHVVYPAGNALPPPTAAVSVLNPANPQDQQLLDWVELNDPAMITAPQTNDLQASQLVPPYRPTYATEVPGIQRNPVNRPPEEISSPSLFTQDNLLMRRERPIASKPNISFPSRLEFGESLETRHPVAPPKLPGSRRVSEPSTFFAGISKEGEVKYLFLWRSSGNDQLDHVADDVVRRIRFEPADKETWGTVTLHWGWHPGSPINP
ncbi:MAG: hypothetical protein JO271_10240 [Verrucomicrobia bacterium]|nr:hypothetical protein [Verrucomicrobiota bacterium]MBV9272327.1 hypothetical protein [Verrucomicrobiota bacterium]